MLDSITYSDKLFNMPITTFLACIGAALALGIGTALIFQFKTKHTASMAITLAIMPPAIALVIMLVNGNIGAGVAVAGAFALVRFRSMPGTAREIAGIFVAMAVGLACGMDQLLLAVALALEGHGSKLLGAGGIHADKTGADQRDEGHVPRQNTQFARLTGQRNELGVTGEDGLFRANDVDFDSSHVSCSVVGRLTGPILRPASGKHYFRVFAFSKASSMVPTM